ncbi:IclR family transcriptional regulator [Rhodococcus sp. 05-340-1]|uniref:IclR family transcriptional regulator n=1 Tax=unclassified Rhodococcus (in: high G+C Gram-positive bacteria) TaxID=192944 RepID=UPI000B9C0A62|nr:MULTISPECIES: IclR family transcriptional regulator [unclassified Rhodococcus (in: high G+C Gram-positive bacteria)]OZD66958.1 IclR family transcriptional regulator [Rhodococcus sp. 05-340-2]OZD81035.1 IclR family transcriptional regulator [Rhodococcus sp. 05-340-1]
MKRDDMSLLERFALILDAFPPGEALGLAHVVTRTGLPRSTAHRMLVDMVSINWVQRAGNEFELGMRLFELGERVPIKHRLRSAAIPFMHDLHTVTGRTVHLGVRDDHDIVYVDKLQGHSPMPLPSQIGGRLPLTCTGVGKALLAFEDADVRQSVLTRPLRRYTTRSVVDADILERQLLEIRRTGIAIEREEAADGGCCVASPIVVDGKAVAAISVSVPTRDFQPELLAPALRTTALGLGRVLARPGS